MIYFIPYRLIFIHETNPIREAASTAGICRTPITVKTMNHIVTDLFFIQFIIDKFLTIIRKRVVPFIIFIKSSITLSMFFFKSSHIFISSFINFIHHVFVSLLLFFPLFVPNFRSGLIKRITTAKRTIAQICKKLTRLGLASTGKTENREQYTQKYNSHALCLMLKPSGIFNYENI